MGKQMMKTLILNGSPRRDGDVAALLGALRESLHGEVKEVSCRDNILPCVDCRRCREQPGCAISDDMQLVYPFLQQCDNVVLASPIWFSSLSGPLLSLASRLQTYWCAGHFRGEAHGLKRKNGVIVFAGAEQGTEKMPLAAARTILKTMNADRENLSLVLSMNTDRVPAAQDAQALRCARETARMLNRLYSEQNH